MANRFIVLPASPTPALHALRRYSQQTQHLMSLTTLITPHLPTGGDWQVAALSQGELCLSTPHHAFAAQLRFCQHGLIPQLAQLKGLETVVRLRVIITPLPAPKRLPPTRPSGGAALSNRFLAQIHALLNETKLT